MNEAEKEADAFWDYITNESVRIATLSHCELCEAKSPACKAKITATADRIRHLVLEMRDHDLPV